VKHERLYRGGAGEDSKRDRDRSDALAGALDALVHKPVRVTMCVLAVIVLTVVTGVVLVWPGVRVGVTQGAVTMQVAFDEFVGSGGHDRSG